MTIRVCSEHDGSEGPHQKTSAKRHQRQHQRKKWITAGEEGIADRGCIITEDHEVVHLQKIAAGDADYSPDFCFPVRESDRRTLIGLSNRFFLT